MDFSKLYSSSTKALKSSKIRELFKMANIPGIISMAGGMPDSDHLPFELIKEIIGKWNHNCARIALQYGTTKGYTPLLQKITEWMKTQKKINMEDQDIIITTGSQQALSLLAKIFVDEGDVVIVEIPSFIGAIASFYSYMSRVEGVPMDEQGMKIEELDNKIKSLIGEGKKVKLIYTIPNFNNPSGITLSSDRRKKLLQVSTKYGIPVIEDDPYGNLYYDGEENDYLPIKSLDKDGNVVYLGSFSKVLSPGLRLGWIVAKEELVAKLELQKQSYDACTPTLSQLIAHDYLEGGYIGEFVKGMREVYRKKRDAMLEALHRNMPEEVKWTTPRGGLFIWVTLPQYVNAEKLFMEAIKHRVAFVTGDAFLPENYPNHYIRLTYGDLPVEKIVEGIKRLSEVIKKMI